MSAEYDAVLDVAKLLLEIVEGMKGRTTPMTFDLAGLADKEEVGRNLTKSLRALGLAATFEDGTRPVVRIYPRSEQ